MSYSPPPPPYRRLLPASERQAAGSDLPKSRRRSEAKITSACLLCKQKRIKCSGGPSPCRSCTEAKADCVFDYSLDQRRKIAGKRRDEDFRSQTQMLDGLFEMIRSGDDGKVQELLAMIRDNASLSTVAATVEANLKTSDGSQKRKRSASPSPVSEELDKALAEQSGSDVHMGETVPSPQASLLPSAAAPSKLLSIPATRRGPSADSIGFRRPSLGSESQSRPITDITEYSTLEMLEESFSEASPNFGDDEWSPVEQPYQAHAWPDNARPTWNSLINVVRDQQKRRQPHPYPKPGYVEVFGNLPMSSAIMTNGYPRKVQIQQLCHFRIPIHLIQSLITFEDSALARVYTDYRDAARHMLARGVPKEEVSGPNFTAIDLFFRDRRPSDPHTASFWACELCKSFGDAPIFVQLAGMYLLTYLMRWTISPTKETYAQVPQMIRPTPSQRLVPHIASVDLVAMSPVRDALIMRMRDFVTSMMSAGVSCNWPYTLDDCFETDESTGQRKLTKVFEEYVSDFDHWSIGSRFLETFPELKSHIHITEQPPTSSGSGSSSDVPL